MEFIGRSQGRKDMGVFDTDKAKVGTLRAQYLGISFSTLQHPATSCAHGI